MKKIKKMQARQVNRSRQYTKTSIQTKPSQTKPKQNEKETNQTKQPTNKPTNQNTQKLSFRFFYTTNGPNPLALGKCGWWCKKLLNFSLAFHNIAKGGEGKPIFFALTARATGKSQLPLCSGSVTEKSKLYRVCRSPN